MAILKMADLDLKGKRVLIRADLNVPLKDGKVASDKRIMATLPTIKLALEKGAKVMVISIIVLLKQRLGHSDGQNVATVEKR